ncbi:type I-G CRISPR-associated protein Csb2 [Actinoplanes philippinensis]|uniref:type I-G CRISPR-associated protein Csb2 n=1 Tax=Actinoplanes philippinensis TaxID=35752 RepID=UPI0033D62D8B
MALSITVRLREGRYDAAVGGNQPEWPPHPARLFAALVASAENDPDEEGFTADTAALRWLEQAGLPVIWAGDALPTQTNGYAVTNATHTPRKAGSQLWPGRTNRASRRVGVLPSDDEVAFVWPDVVADDAVLWRLTRLARRVPYLGRSTSTVQIEVADEVAQPKAAWTAWRPVALGTPGSSILRVPYVGYRDDLQALYEAGQDSWELSRAGAYALDLPVDPVVEPAPRAFRDLVVFPLERGVPLSGNGFLTVTEVLRRTVISRVADPVPAQASGHGADDRRHVAFLPLLDVGHRHARGHVLGVAVAIPSDMPDNDRVAVLRGLLDSTDPAGPDRRAAENDGPGPIRQLRLGSAGLLRLADPVDAAEARTGTWGLWPGRWTGPEGGARRWTTVTPVMLDHYPGRRYAVEDLLAAGFVRAGYPEPETVTVLEGPLPQASVPRPRRGTIPEKWDRRPLVHCRVKFSQPVQGPVIAGALRYLGCGLLVPEVAW